jgi:hypothetical protein
VPHRHDFFPLLLSAGEDLIGMPAMEPSPAPDPSPSSGDTTAKKASDELFSEEADAEAITETLTPDAQSSPIKRYLYLKVVPI